MPIIFVVHSLGGWIFKEVLIPNYEENTVTILTNSILIGDNSIERQPKLRRSTDHSVHLWSPLLWCTRFWNGCQSYGGHGSKLASSKHHGLAGPKIRVPSEKQTTRTFLQGF